MGDLLESFLVSVRVRIKHAEKTRVDFWGQSAILKVVWDMLHQAFWTCTSALFYNGEAVNHTTTSG